jgi:CheY-like chemotaxis protein
MSNKEKILVVDDEVMMRDMLYNLLVKQDYQVMTAVSGEEAIVRVKQNEPDLIILDLMMPKMNGLETLKRIRQIDKSVEVIILTGIAIDDLDKQAQALGVSEIIRKGVGVELFLKSINYALDKRRAKKTAPEQPKASKGRIMVVDDEAEIRFVLEKFLIKHGYEVVTAQSGEEAIQRITQEPSKPPQLVLLDIQMSGMDGLVALKKIKEINNNIGVVMVSGLTDLDIAQKAIELGAYDYIMKPFNLEYLEMVVLTKLLLSE